MPHRQACNTNRCDVYPLARKHAKRMLPVGKPRCESHVRESRIVRASYCELPLPQPRSKKVIGVMEASADDRMTPPRLDIIETVFGAVCMGVGDPKSGVSG